MKRSGLHKPGVSKAQLERQFGEKHLTPNQLDSEVHISVQILQDELFKYKNMLGKSKDLSERKKLGAEITKLSNKLVSIKKALNIK